MQNSQVRIYNEIAENVLDRDAKIRCVGICVLSRVGDDARLQRLNYLVAPHAGRRMRNNASSRVSK